MTFRGINKIPAYAISICKTELIRHMPWLYRFLPVKLRSANVNVTDRCCFKCVMCNQWSNPAKNELSTDEWKDVFRQLKKMGVRRINISGGEPLLRSDIAELIDFATSLGLGTTLLTNGFLLDEDKLQKLIESGLDSISISVDGVGAYFEKVRGFPGAYEKVEHACRSVSRESQRGSIRASVSFVLMKETAGYLKDVLDLRRSLRVPLAINLADFTPYFFKGRKKEQFWIDDPAAIAKVQEMLVSEKMKEPGSIILLYSEIDFIKHYFADPLQKRIPCIVSQERVCIDPEGSIFGGCWSGGSFGNVRDKSLHAIVHSPKYRESHKRMFFKMCPGCSCGYSVNLRNFSQFVLQEVVFRMLPSYRKNISI